MNQEKTYEIGACTIEITPPLSIPYLAGDPRHDYFTGVHDPLVATAAVVGGGGPDVAIVSIDSTGICLRMFGDGTNFMDLIKRRIGERSGIPAERVMVLSTHAHSTPDTTNFRPLREVPGALQWLDEYVDKIASSVAGASANRFQARLKIGKGIVEELPVNRRGDPWVDPEVIVLRFESVDGNRQVLMVNYALHPVIVQVQELVSADFVGAMRMSLQDKLPGMTDCLFIQGACADINPRCGGNTRDFDHVASYGDTLADEVLRICRKLDSSSYPVESAVTAAESRKITLESRKVPAEEEYVREMGAQGIPVNDEAIWRIKDGDSRYEAEPQFIRIGSAVLVGIPGETFCQMGLRFKQIFKPYTAVPAGFANGYLGYLAPQEAWDKGGYEVELGPWSKVGPDGYDILMRNAEQYRSRMTGL